MKVAGIGFRGAAEVSSLLAALERAGGNVQALATARIKAEAPQLVELSRRLDLPILPIEPEILARQVTPTPAPRAETRFGPGSLAEAAALAAAGPGARLIAPRVTSPDGMATAAIAEGTPS